MLLIKAGSWAVPWNLDRARRLDQILGEIQRGNLIYVDEIISKLYDNFGDDSLFDDLDNYRKISGQYFVKIIKDNVHRLVRQYEEAPETFKVTFEPEALELLKKIINTPTKFICSSWINNSALKVKKFENGKRKYCVVDEYGKRRCFPSISKARVYKRKLEFWKKDKGGIEWLR